MDVMVVIFKMEKLHVTDVEKFTNLMNIYNPREKCHPWEVFQKARSDAIDWLNERA